MKENKSNTVKNASNKNSIERDIHLLESYAGMTHKMTDNQGRPKLDQAIERVLLDYKRVLKENEELKEDNMTYKRILDLADNRIYRKKYLEERRKEQPNLLYPDSDEIYQRYYELKQENEKLKTKLLNILEAQKVIKVETLSYIKENYIPIQKVKDKIEEKIQEAEKDLQKAIELEKETKTKEDSILWWTAQIRLDEKIKVFKEILKEVKKDGNGDNV